MSYNSESVKKYEVGERYKFDYGKWRVIKKKKIVNTYSNRKERVFYNRRFVVLKNTR